MRLLFRTLAGSVGTLALLASSAARSESLFIGGLVLDVDGLPAADVRAMLEGVSEPAFASFPEASRRPVATATTDADGRFRLAAPAAGAWRVVVEAPGRAAAALDLPGLVTDVELPPVEPIRAGKVALRVVDTVGTPVPGAQILALPAGTAALEPPWRPVAEALLTDAEGGAWLTAAGPVELAVVAAGFPVTRQRLDGAATLTLRLGAGAPRQVRVVGADGLPVAAVRAAVDGVAWPTASDAEGRLAIVLEPGRQVSLRLLAADGRWAAGRLEPASQDDEPDALFRLRPPAFARGEVAERGSQRPLSGAWVWAVADPARGVLSDGRGRFELAVPFTPPVRLAAARGGYLPAQTAVASDAAALQLAPAAELRGRVEDERGRPVDGAQLRLDLADRALPPPAEARWMRSDAAGSFRLPGIDPVPTYWLRASRPGHVAARLTVSGLVGGHTAPPVRVVLPRGREARGVVLDAAEQPLSGATVRCLPSALAADAEGWLTADEALRTAVSGGDGGFLLTDLASGRVDLNVTAPGFAPAWARGVELPPIEDEAAPIDIGTFVLEPEAALAGSVVDTDGAPVEGAVITVAESGTPARWPRDGDAPPSTSSDAEGSFTVRGLAPGDLVNLHAEHPDYVANDVQATAGDGAEVAIVLAPASRLEGRIVDADGAPVAGAAVLATVDHAAVSRGGAAFAGRRTLGSARSDDDGHFVVRGVEPCRMRLQALAPGFLPVATDVEVTEGEVLADLELVLDRGAAVEGTVRDADGLPVAGAQVAAVVDSGDLASRLQTPVAVADADGRYRLTGLAPGRWTLRAEHPDHVRAEARLEVRPGDNTLDLRLGRGVEVAGQALDAAGEPVAGARVSLVAESEARAFDPAATGGSGGFRFRAVPPGTYHLVGERTGHAAALSPAFEVAGVPLAGLELRFAAGAAVAGQLLGLDLEQAAAAEVWAGAPGIPGRRGVVLADGRYRIENLGPGEWTVAARAPGFSREATARVNIEPGASETLLDLEFASGGFVLTGTVLRAGRPLPGALVASTGADGASGGSLTDADGRFQLTDLSPGPLQLTVLHPASGQTLTRVLDLEGNLQVRFELPEPGSGEGSPPNSDAPNPQEKTP